jgi:hypothetical protein
MKKIELEDTKVGDCIKLTQEVNNDGKDILYFIVDKKTKKGINSNKIFSFKEDKFEQIYRLSEFTFSKEGWYWEETKVELFKLTEDEYYSIVGKYGIADVL